jgi:DNA-binding transcriptional LysR family regulator
MTWGRRIVLTVGPGRQRRAVRTDRERKATVADGKNGGSNREPEQSVQEQMASERHHVGIALGRGPVPRLLEKGREAERIEEGGAPAQPANLRGFRCIALRENDEDATRWQFRKGKPDEVVIWIDPTLASNDGEVVRQWAIAGAGIIARSEWSIADDLRAGRLVELLPDFAMPSADIVALLPARRGRSARTAQFVEFLQRALQPVPWRS